MATFRRQKEALRSSLFAFFAGAHYVTEQVDKSQGILPGGSSQEAVLARRTTLEADYKRFCESNESVDMLAEILDEEDLYPYGNEWPREPMMHLMGKLIAPPLAFEEGQENPRFRFKKGFKELLNDFATNVEGTKRDRSTLDHWLVLVLNAAFYAGAVCASRMAQNTKMYFSAVQEIEEEIEPWTKYPQLGAFLDKQLSRETKRRTGLVRDFDI